MVSRGRGGNKTHLVAFLKELPSSLESPSQQVTNTQDIVCLRQEPQRKQIDAERAIFREDGDGMSGR